ncbi:hypothetical protein AAF712_014062 [Marasmius tenuissimus]|uniref:GmrSD restriction endonucleases N-terminal domain-containing protein n=1 Tax=Marasmius tenuissimus TaxID=585030 RepID=A0ABR2ZC94_9AGAR
MSTCLTDDRIYDPDFEDEDNETDDLNIKGENAKYPKYKTEVLSDYKITRALKKPRSETCSIELLYKQAKDNLIDLNAEYQRDVVWTTEKQSFLIDSIFSNFYIPPIIFSVRTLENGDELRICIDGKQRLTAMFAFMEGKIPYKDKDTGRKIWFIDNPDQPWSSKQGKKRLLPPNLKINFEKRAIFVVEYDEVAQQEERDIFKRVQLGVPLSAAEKLQAITTPRVKFIQELRSRFMVPEKLGSSSIPWDRSRCRDFHSLALCLHYAVTWDFTIPNSPLISSDALGQWLSGQHEREKGTKPDDISVPEELQTHTTKTLEVMSQLFTDPAYNQPFVSFSHNGIRKALSPIDVIGTFFLVFKLTQSSSSGAVANPELRTLSQLGEILRRDVRESKLGIMMRSALLNFAQKFCVEAARNPAKMIHSRSRMLTGLNSIPTSTGLSHGPVAKGAKWKVLAAGSGYFGVSDRGQVDITPASRASTSSGKHASRARKPTSRPGPETSKRLGDKFDDEDSDYNPGIHDTPAIPVKRRRCRSSKTTD